MATKMVAAAAAAAAAKGGKGDVKAGDTAWIDVQTRTFTNWVNVQLESSGTKVNNLGEDIKNGVKLLQALEFCAKKAVGKYSKAPKMKANELENCGLILTFLKAEGLTVVNIGPSDINDGNQKLMLGLVWTIIYHYQVSAGFKGAGAANSKTANAKDLLLEWVRSKIPEYDVKNFTSDWLDGRALCALVNVIAGEPFVQPNHRQMSPEAALQNCKTGVDLAKEYLDLPKLIAPEDLSSTPDELSVMTYISYFRDAKRVERGPKLPPSLDNEDGRKKMACQVGGCGKMRSSHATHCPDHACLHESGCNSVAVANTHACAAHKCQHGGAPACGAAVVGASKACPAHACAHVGCGGATAAHSPFCPEHACHHPVGTCRAHAAAKSTFCEAHTCIHTGCKSPAVEGDKWCTTHTKAASKGGALPPPWERKADWRKYTGTDLGGRCKIRVYFSTTTSSHDIRKNNQALMMLLERENVHKRPDFEPWVPIDVDMTKEKRDAVFEKAGTKVTPLLFIDDEFVGDYAKVMELNESGKLHKLLEY